MTSPEPNLRPRSRFARFQMAGFLTNTRVGWKLAVIIAVLIGGTIGIFLAALSGMQELNYHVSNIYNFKLVPIATIGQAESALVNAQDQLRILHNARLTPFEQSSAFRVIADSEKSFSEIITRYETEWLTTRDATFTQQLRDSGKMSFQVEEVKTLAALKSSFETYVSKRKVFQLVQEKGLYDAVSEDDALAAIKETRSNLRKLITINTQFADLSNKAAQADYNKAILVMGSTLFVAALFGLILAFVVARSITSRLGKMTQAARALEQGSYQQNIRNIVSGEDEIGEMASAFDTMATQITQALSGLEERVNNRTSELQGSSTQLIQRAAQLEAVSAVSSAIAAIRDIDILLPKVAELISERFGFYHTGIFTLNEAKDFALLSAASSEGGKRMMERNHKLPIGPGSLVGFVANRGVPRIAMDVEQDAMHNANPDLPETRAEMALPLLAGPTLIGVLDVQSTKPGAFSEQDVNILTTLANQVAAAMQNAQLFSETREALGEAEKVYQQFVQQGWQQITNTGTTRGYRYSMNGLEPMERPAAATIETRKPDGAGSTTNDYLVPLRLRNQIIGALDIKSTDPSHKWDTDELAIIHAAAERASLALENARLLEESQRRAAKERVIGEISSKISEAANTENILKTAVSELGLLVPDTEITIKFLEENDSPAD